VGLDTYAERVEGDLTQEDRSVFEALDLTLCEWIGDGSFRGKVYDEVVSAVTGVSLYREWISPEEVAKMAAAFQSCDPEAVARATKDDRYPATPDEVRALGELLRICAGRGLGLAGSW
jgi:hypothetical protein